MSLSWIYACENAGPFWALLGFVSGAHESDANQYALDPSDFLLCSSSGAGIQLYSPKIAKVRTGVPCLFVCLYSISFMADGARHPAIAALLQSVYSYCTVQFTSYFVCCCRVRAFGLEDTPDAASSPDVGGL